MTLKKLYILTIAITCVFYTSYGQLSSSVQNTITVTPLFKDTVFKAGTSIPLQFKLNGLDKVQFVCNTSYGISVLNSHKEPSGYIYYTLPAHIAQKTGVLNYQLAHNTKIIYTGKITIIPNTEKAIKIESYIGPPSIIAGGEDYTMLVVAPTDYYDNPVPDSTAILVKHQFLDIKKNETILSKNFIGWKNLFSYERSGQFLIASEVNQIQSKEFAIEVFPAQASNFTINGQRKHKYADGNQITTFKTSIIKDNYGNIVSDGTLVEFLIKNKKGNILKTQGTTIEGIAKGKILHPDHKDLWEVKAYITGMAISNTLEITYESITTAYSVNFSPNNRTITIGPLQSFMKQIIPDGAIVKLLIFKENKWIETKTKTSKNGLVVFNLPEGFYESTTYDFKTIVFGIEKEFKNIKI